MRPGKDLPPTKSDLLSASDARRLTLEGVKNTNEQELDSIMKKIKFEANKGHTECLCGSISKLNQKKLIDLGYKVESHVSYFVGWIYTISW